jgi:hypothetical protein
LEYGVGLIDPDLESEAGRFALDFGRRMIEAPFVAALPDVADRELVGMRSVSDVMRSVHATELRF